MGNIFQTPKDGGRHQSEIPFDFFAQNFNASQIPKNRLFPYDSELYSITHKTTNKTYTVKRMTFASEDMLQAFLQSLEHVISLRHPHILRIESYFVQKNYCRDTVISHSVNIIMENFTHTLKDEIAYNKLNNTSYKEPQIKQLLTQLLDAMKFLELKDICHGSICPANIFITSDNKYKLCFTGEPILKVDNSINPNLLLLIDYMAPKLRTSLTTAVISGNLSFKMAFDKHRSDVFSLGLILLEMTSLKNIQGLNITGSEAERLTRVQDCTSKVLSKLLKLIELMLLENELERPNFRDLEGLIQIQHDEASEWSHTYRLERQSFIMQQSLQRESNKAIELKTIEDHSEQKKAFNSHFGSLMSEFMTEENTYSKPNQVSPYPLNGDSGASEDHFAGNHYGSKNTYAGSLSEKYIQNLMQANQPLQHPLEIAPKVKTPSPDQIEERLIFTEEDLLKPMSPNVKKLVVKIKEQPQSKNFAELLANCISKQRLLQELVITLPSMSLGKRGVTTVIHSMLGLDHLRVLFLELRKDRVSVEALKDLGLILQDKRELEQLGIDLASNSLTADMCRQLVLALQDLDHLKFLALNLGGNQLKSEDLIEISGLTGRLKNLENLVLYLYSNEVENAEGINVLVRNVGKLEKLKSLTIDLSDNLIGDQGATYALNYLKENTGSLKRVYFEMLNNCMSEQMREKMQGQIKGVTNVTLHV